MHLLVYASSYLHYMGQCEIYIINLPYDIRGPVWRGPANLLGAPASGEEGPGQLKPFLANLPQQTPILALEGVGFWMVFGMYIATERPE